MAGRRATACEFPSESALAGPFVDAADHVDAFGVPLARREQSVTDIFYAIFAHRPYWLRLLLAARNAAAAKAGLDTTPASQMLKPQIKPYHAVGDTIGGWRIYALSSSELIVGRDNPHMDFRLSIVRFADARLPCAVVATVCKTKNAFGRTYLASILPFHKRGLRMLLDNVLAAGRM